MSNTLGATAASAMAWAFIEWAIKGKPTTLGLITGMVIGLVAVTPAASRRPMGAIALGIASSAIWTCGMHVDEEPLRLRRPASTSSAYIASAASWALSPPGFSSIPKLGGSGVADYIAQPGQITISYDMATQMTAQIKAVVLTLVWSGVISAILFKFVDLVIGLRPPKDKERAGLDLTEHGERAYHF